jgi:hypothetical protein
LSRAARLLYLIVAEASMSVFVQAAFNPKTGDEAQLLEPR